MNHRCEGSTYELKTCVRCAARLVKSVRPSRNRQEAMLEYVSRWHSRDAVINEITKASK